MAKGLGLPASGRIEGPTNQSIPADGKPAAFQPRKPAAGADTSPALSMLANPRPKDGLKTRQVAALATDGVDDASLDAITTTLTRARAVPKIVAHRLGELKTAGGKAVRIDFSLLTTYPVLFDAVFVAAGRASVETLGAEPDFAPFVTETYRHCKTLGAAGEAVELVEGSLPASMPPDDGVVLDAKPKAAASRFLEALASQRWFDREKLEV